MNRVLCLLAGATFVATAVMAQSPAAGPVGVSLALQRQYAQAKASLTSGAEKLTAADYNFKPTPDIRSVRRAVHSRRRRPLSDLRAGQRRPNPIQGTSLEQTKTARADVIKALADSFAFCDDAFSTLTDQTASQLMTGGRGGPQSKAAILMNIVAHDNEMYGISTVYQRLKGVVPPSTEQMMMRRGGPGGGGRGTPAGPRPGRN